MFILNLELQCIELIRIKMDDEFEKIIKYYNSIKNIWNKAEKESQLKE